MQLNSEQKESFFKSFAITIKNYFPQLGIWLSNVKDPRYTAKATYHRSIMFWTVIFLFLLKLQSSRNINYQLNQSRQFLTNFQALFPLLHVREYQPLERMPDYGAVIDMLKRVSPEQLEKVQVKMVKDMIKKRALENSRLLEKYYLAAIDGTQMLTFNKGIAPIACARKLEPMIRANPFICIITIFWLLCWSLLMNWPFQSCGNLSKINPRM